MADESNPLDASAMPDNEPLVTERVQELTWSLVDEQITDDEMRLLDNLLLSDNGARDVYVGCIQLHTDLLDHFGSLPRALAATENVTSPVLGFLNHPTLPMESQPPAADDSRS